MSAGLFISASGLLTASHRLDVASNNLANVNTAAFKRDVAFSVVRPAAREEDGLFHLDSNEMLERLGGGLLSAPSRIDFSQGALQQTDNPLDAAIVGEGFFVVDALRGEGAERMRLTRDGRFVIDAAGTLVTADSGLPLLDMSMQPITLDPASPAALGARGEVIQNGGTVAMLLLAQPDTGALVKTEGGLYTSEDPGALDLSASGTARLKPGALEGSDVDPIKAMMAVTAAGSAVRNNGRLMQLHDELMERVINRLGSVR